METVIGALITGGLALAGVIITSIMGNNKIEKKLEISQAVTDTKLDALTEEVKMHNNFAQRMPVIEAKFDSLEARVSKIEEAQKK